MNSISINDVKLIQVDYQTYQLNTGHSHYFQHKLGREYYILWLQNTLNLFPTCYSFGCITKDIKFLLKPFTYLIWMVQVILHLCSRAIFDLNRVAQSTSLKGCSSSIRVTFIDKNFLYALYYAGCLHLIANGKQNPWLFWF